MLNSIVGPQHCVQADQMNSIVTMAGAFVPRYDAMATTIAGIPAMSYAISRTLLLRTMSREI